MSPRLAQGHPWEFHTKLELAVELVRWVVDWLGRTDKALWLAVNGAYAKGQFLKRVRALTVVVVGRLRKDADPRGLPPDRKRRACSTGEG
jgi:hypothetical protein